MQTANVSARVTARIEKILCDEGDQVKKGQVLMVLEEQEIRKNIASAAAQVSQAMAELSANEATATALKSSAAYWRREAERDRALAEKGHIPGSQAEAAIDKAGVFQAQYKAAVDKSESLRQKIRSLRAVKEELETRLGYYTLVSPYNGMIRERLVDPGDMAAPGKRLLVVENRNGFKLAFDIPQSDLPGVKKGQPVLFKVDQETRKAVLTHTFPSLNLAKMLRAEVDLSDNLAEGLSMGQYLPVSVVIREIEDATLIPRTCLIEGPEQETYVFLLKGDRLTPRGVKVLAAGGDRLAVTGMAPGEQAVTSTFLGWARLSAENRVEVQR
ncbi:MAG: efflux RND transporter periplasmic adaptor subunit [Deltaproteobacteria bacterium]|nr:efflux RND transporter periplasmic adaptor subunit [Deltaproteobacteria bacterium]